MSARVEIDASGSQTVMPAYTVGRGWGFGSERAVEVDLRISFSPEDAVLVERVLDDAVRRARADLAPFLPK